MEHVGFDTLTKALTSRATRRVSLGLLAAGLFGLTSVADDAAARKRKRRKRKRKNRGGGNDRPAPGGAVCHAEGISCTSAGSCCSGTCDFLVGGGTCAPCRGRSCNASQPCCGGEACTNGFCGGCRDRAVSCNADTDCCFSDCTSGACLSAQGGRCERDVDCRACYLNQNCNGVCVNGSCTA